VTKFKKRANVGRQAFRDQGQRGDKGGWLDSIFNGLASPREAPNLPGTGSHWYRCAEGGVMAGIGALLSLVRTPIRLDGPLWAPSSIDMVAGQNI